MGELMGELISSLWSKYAVHDGADYMTKWRFERALREALWAQKNALSKRQESVAGTDPPPSTTHDG